MAEGLPTGDGPPALEANESDNCLPNALVIAIVICSPPSVTVLPISGAIVVGAVIVCPIATVTGGMVLLPVTIALVVLVFLRLRTRTVSLKVIVTGTAALLVSRALEGDEVVFDIEREAVFLIATVTVARADGHWDGVAATRAARIRIAIT